MAIVPSDSNSFTRRQVANMRLSDYVTTLLMLLLQMVTCFSACDYNMLISGTVQCRNRPAYVV